MRELIMAAAARLQGFVASLRRIAWSGVVLAGAGFILLLWAVYAPPPALVGLLVEPSGSIYVSSPGVYTRERLVNDRNDQDFWLRAQLDKLDKHLVGFSTVQGRTRSASVTAARSNSGDEAATNGEQASVLPSGSTEQDGARDVDLSFMDSFVLRSAWRDSIRHAMLENLLDDRHDLTGNSVYGLKFDTTVYPGWYTTGRAFVRISISTDQAQFTSRATDADSTDSGLPPLIESFYDSNYAEVLFDRRNPNYLSYTLYKQWLANVKYRLNSHLTQIYDLKCPCVGAHCQAASWAEEIGRSVDTVLATSRTTVTPVEGIQSARVILPDPWNAFLMITVDGLSGHRCGKPPQFDVAQVVDTIHLFGDRVKDTNFRAIESVDAEDSAYYYLPEGAAESLYKPRSRNIRAIARIAKQKEKVIDHCIDDGDGEERCSRYLSIPTGYFNFVQHVIRSDSYVYSLFPRSEADAVLNLLSGSGEVSYESRAAGARISAAESVSEKRAALNRTSVGFADASPSWLKAKGTSDGGSASSNSEAMDFGWVIEVGVDNAPVQKSQFALISVPAWASRLTVTVQTGWLDADSTEIPDEPYSFVVPIPPDYEAFDAFIGGEEAVRRPQINRELMDNVQLFACREARILIPGLRLWRSAMVTLGAERANRITVLPNMGGIIAVFTELAPTMEEGPAKLRVWTSEGVDMVTDKVTVAIPENCGAEPATAAPLTEAMAAPDEAVRSTRSPRISERQTP